MMVENIQTVFLILRDVNQGECYVGFIVESVWFSRELAEQEIERLIKMEPDVFEIEERAVRVTSTLAE